jgi:hypothetical protein
MGVSPHRSQVHRSATVIAQRRCAPFVAGVAGQPVFDISATGATRGSRAFLSSRTIELLKPSPKLAALEGGLLINSGASRRGDAGSYLFSCLKFESEMALASPLPLAGEVDALGRARRVGKAASTKNLFLVRHPHPNPPPQAGEGARHRRSYSAAFARVGGRYCAAGCGAVSRARPAPNNFSRSVPLA